jgi:predicted nucleic acid-binding protein
VKGVLVDTSVRGQHFQRGNPRLQALLAQDSVLTHPLVLLEIACGTPPSPRTKLLRDLGLLRPVQQASLAEVSEFIEREELFGQGCGAVDIQLLASALLTANVALWTLDKRLAAMAERFGVGFAG